MVKLILFSTLSFVFFLVSCNYQDEANVSFIPADSLTIIPQPMRIEKREGYFTINENTYLNYASDVEREAEYLKSLIESSSTFELKRNVDAKRKPFEIELKIVSDFPEEMQNGESYKLIISNEMLQITALTSTGIMRGIQTMRQMFELDFHKGNKRNAWYVPCIKIEDTPKFEHRGLLLDVCRHYFDKTVVLKYIDALAFYKMNVLHFHLTEDQGWRMPIDTYPLLNQVSSFRKEKDGSTYGGFFTKEDLKEIVAYASERHIVVIPEIELPGHAQAALAAYPQYSCNGGPIEVANDWGVFKDIYCAGNDSTFIFLENILLEVMEIFPSEYIHIGGDEAPKFRWEHCQKCQKRMRDEGLKDAHELQSYFIKRIENFLNENGRKLIGWDEILEGGLSPNATVQSWRGFEGGMQAAKEKHYVIMSPTSHCYLDYGLDAIDLKKIYSFNPIPENLPKELYKYILGGECNIWTERVPDENTLDERVFPRMIALSEVLWSGPDTNRYEDFKMRLLKHYPILDFLNIHYGYETIPFQLRTLKKGNKTFVEIVNQIPESELEYSFDSNWKRYTEPIELKETMNLKVRSTKKSSTLGPEQSFSFEEHLALFKKVNYSTKYNDWYPANKELGLVDGKIGSLNFRDGNWQGFWGNNAEVIIDFENEINISSIQIGFLEYVNAWIMQPRGIELWTSLDNLKFELINDVAFIPLNSLAKDGISLNPILMKFPSVKTRYLKVKVTNYGKLPASHEAAGQDAWLFMDEIIVK